MKLLYKLTHKVGSVFCRFLFKSLPSTFLFRNILQYRDKTIVVLNCGLGDHIVFNHVLPSIHRPEVFTCYPEVVPGRSIAEAIQLFGDIDHWNVYKKMDQWKWKGNLEGAYRKLYL